MNTMSDFDRRAAAWLTNGPTELNDRVLEAALREVRLTHQQRALRMPWRSFPMNPSVRLVTMALAVIVALGAIVYAIVPRDIAGPSQPPAATPSARPSLPPTAATTSTGSWLAFSSVRYGYDIKYPQTWTATPAERNWTLQVDRGDRSTPATDAFMPPDGPGFTAFSVSIAGVMTESSWISTFYGPPGDPSPDPCSRVPVVLPLAEVDGHRVHFFEGVPSSACGGTGGFVAVGDRLYVFTIWQTGSHDLLQTLLSTVTFER